MSVEDALYDYVIESCDVIEDDVFAFFAFIDPQKDGKSGYEHLSPRRIIHYFGQEDRWEWLDTERKGHRSSAAGFTADGTRETIFTLSLNDVISFRYNNGSDGPEERIPFETVIGAQGINFIDGHFFVVGTNTTLARREGPNDWRQVYTQTTGIKVDLHAIDGYAQDDMYVTGIDDDHGIQSLFHFDGTQMALQNVPADLHRKPNFMGIAICCAPDGTVYAVHRNGGLIAGSKNERWRTLIEEKDVETQEIFDMVWFKGSLYATSLYWLYRFDGSNWEPINPEAGFKPIAFGFVSANENVLLAAGPFGASVFDGTEWKSIYAQVTLEELAVKDALEKQLGAVESVLDMFGIDKGGN